MQAVSHLGLAKASPMTTPAPQRRTIPYDYQFYFKIFDEKDAKKNFIGQVQSSTVTVSIEAAFVAVSVGYGFLPRVTTIRFGVEAATAFPPALLPFGGIINSLSKGLGEAKKVSEVVRKDAIVTSPPPPPAKVTVGPLTERALLAGFQLNTAVSQHVLQVLQDGSPLSWQRCSKQSSHHRVGCSSFMRSTTRVRAGRFRASRS